jgi:hypothetical protein
MVVQDELDSAIRMAVRFWLRFGFVAAPAIAASLVGYAGWKVYDRVTLVYTYTQASIPSPGPALDVRPRRRLALSS